MLRSIYSAASGMIAQRERLDVIANNVANLGTVGFKRAEATSRGFYQVFAGEVARFPARRGSLATPGGGAAVDATHEDYSGGPIVDTGNPLDAAIMGTGFFVVRTPAGERYTRAGNFTLGPEGQLITQDGYAVLGERGPILVQGERVELSPDGTISVDGVPAEQLLIVDFPEPDLLSKYGQNLYGAVEQVRQSRQEVDTPSLRVGALEHSNVNPIAELTSLMDAARSYDSQQRVIQALDESLQAAVNEIARA
jgi:flagellar basal-body rod protein FlgG